MQTLADLKRRLTVGTRVTLVECMPGHKFFNIPRFVIKVQTKQISMHPDKDATKGGSWLEFPKVANLRLGEDWFTVLPEQEGDSVLTYKIG